MAVIIIVLRRNKAKVKAVLEQSSRAEGALSMDSTYDTTTRTSPTVSAINTQDNVAYCHTHVKTWNNHNTMIGHWLHCVYNNIILLRCIHSICREVCYYCTCLLLYYYCIYIFFFQKVLFCVITYLIGQNNKAVCKRHGSSWRCIQRREALCASYSGAGWAGHGHRVHTSHTSIELTFKRSESIAIALTSWATDFLL